MFPEAFLPAAKLEIVGAEFDSANSMIQLKVRSRATDAVCPFCGEHSRGVHSTYERTLKDLPCSGYSVSIALEVRRFFCKTALVGEKYSVNDCLS